MQLVIKGFIHGKNKFNDVDIKMDNSYSCRGLADYIQSYIESRQNVKSFKDYKRCIGRNIDIIDNCSIQMFFLNEKCTLEEAQTSLLEKLDGKYYSDKVLTGWSEYTITGYNVRKCQIGGHNLVDIVASHKDEYMILVMEW